MTIDGVEVTVEDVMGVTEQEAMEYVAYGRQHVRGRLTKLVIRPGKEADEVELLWTAKEKFERIRRITGYLVGTIDRWNNAKRAEEQDRVKHLGGERKEFANG